MASSHRDVFHFVVVNMMLYIGVVVGLNCDSMSFPTRVSFCSGGGSIGRAVYLSGINNNTNGIGCNCSISTTSSTLNSVKIEIKNITTTSKLCDYNLYSVYMNTSQILYSCNQNLNIHSFDLRPMETVGLHMEKGTVNSAGFPFCLHLVSERDSEIKLQCRSNTTTTTHLNSTSTWENNNNISTSSTEVNDGTSITTFTFNFNSNISSTSPKPQPNTDDSNQMIGLIIGSIVGVLVVVALVIIIVCLVKRRKKKTPYETPLESQDRPHSHVNTAGTPSSNENGYNNHNTKPGNQGMIYLENDLYKSIDDDEPVGRKVPNHEGMIYLENDLYISSGETDDVHQDAEKSVPHQPVEYAVVNKTKKNSSGNDASTGHTIGPHGDEYTLVQRK